MRVDWSQLPMDDEEKQLIRVLRGARAVAATLVIGGIALVGATSGPVQSDFELAAAQASGAVETADASDRNLMALESGSRI